MRTACLLLLAACHGGDDGSDPTDGNGGTSSVFACQTDDDCGQAEICGTEGTCELGERNDGPEGAEPIGTTSEPGSDGVIDPPGDVDWFVYTAVGGEWLDIRTLTSGDRTGNLNTVVRVWRGDGVTEYAAIDDFATGLASGYDSILRVYLPDPGEWYITVEDVSTYYTDVYPSESDWRGGESFTYQLWLQEFSANVDEPDSMDSPAASVAMADGDTIWSLGVLLEDPGDSDWVSIDLTAPGEPLEVWAQPSDLGSTADLEVRLYDPLGAVIADKTSVGPDGYLSYFDPDVGTYAVEATDAAGGGGPAAWAVLYMRTYNAGDYHPFFGDNEYVPEVEPNDAPASATLVETVEETSDITYLEGRLEGEFLTAGDVDQYAVVVPADDRVSVRCFVDRFGSLADLAVAVLDPSLVDVTPSGQGSNPTPGEYYVYNLVAAESGNYTVSISSEDGTFGAQDYYRCAVYLTDVDVDQG